MGVTASSRSRGAVDVLLVGLDAAGKTTLLYQCLKQGQGR
eukprot:SAG31_NODE_38687_length_294_cov_0.794872_1_plen_39_part_10